MFSLRSFSASSASSTSFPGKSNLFTLLPLHIASTTSTGSVPPYLTMPASGEATEPNLDDLFASLRSSTSQASPHQSVRSPAAQDRAPFGFDGSITSRHPQQSGITHSLLIRSYLNCFHSPSLLQSILLVPSMLLQLLNLPFSTSLSLDQLHLHPSRVRLVKVHLTYGQSMEAPTPIASMDEVYPLRT